MAVLLVIVFVLSSFLDNIAAALIGGTVAATVFRHKVHIGYIAALVAASNAGGSGSVLGASLEGASYRQRLQDALEETQQLNEELQTQQEELRVSNEELEEQGRILRESQARLETQQAELEGINSALESQAQILERQKDDLASAQRTLEARDSFRDVLLPHMKPGLIAGSLLYKGRTFIQWEPIFLSPDEQPLPLRAGPGGTSPVKTTL